MKHKVAAMFVGLFAIAVAAQTFHGYACTQDCSGHEAGFVCAQARGVTSRGPLAVAEYLP